MGNQTKLSGLRMAYPGSMDTPPALLHEVWQRTPPEAQASHTEFFSPSIERSSSGATSAALSE